MEHIGGPRSADTAPPPLAPAIRLHGRWCTPNTATNGEALEIVGDRQPVISHIHELATTIRMYGTDNFDSVRRHTTRYIACSESVKNDLTSHWPIEPGAVDVVREFVHLPPALDESTRDVVRRRIRRELGIPLDAFVIGGSGVVTWRNSAGALHRPGTGSQEASAVGGRALRVGGGVLRRSRIARHRARPAWTRPHGTCALHRLAFQPARLLSRLGRVRHGIARGSVSARLPGGTRHSACQSSASITPAT